METELEIYLVGGAVRDGLLGRPVVDRDWVVVGSTVKEMLSRGFIQVGRDFPVFLHPDSKEEYALARTERKSGSGHTGFEVFASEDVTLQEDLERRDLTVNAIARTSMGDLIDPYGGCADIDAKLLRHVACAFTEDPLRILRVARFAAQLEGFQVAPETVALLAEMCGRGELLTLAAERVWGEFERAMAGSNPEAFFAVLRQAGGLAPWFEELADKTWQFDVDINVGRDVGGVVQRLVNLPLTETEFETFFERLKAPGRYLQVVQDVLRHGAVFSAWSHHDANTLAASLLAVRAQHSAERLDAVMNVVGGIEPQGLRVLAATFQATKLAADVEPGPTYGAALQQARVESIARALDAKSE